MTFVDAKNNKQVFGMADGNNMTEVVEVVQQTMLKAMEGMVADIKVDNPNPGMTWEQLDKFFQYWREKKPTVITQKGPM